MFSVSFDVAKIDRVINGLEQDLKNDGQAMMQAIGVQVLSFVKIDYDVKGRGGTGSDGISWDKIKRSTAEVIARRLGPVRRMVAQRQQLAEQIRSMKGIKANEKRVQQLRTKRANLLQKINAEIDRIWNSHQTGVDTGLQRSSASPGFTAAGGGNVLIATPQSVTVGFGRSYSGYFDEQRKLMPATLPAQWEKDLESLVQRRIDRIARNRTDQQG